MPPQGDLQLRIGYWVVSHKSTLRKWWAISLMAFIALSFLWGLVFMVVFFSQNGTVNTQLSRRTVGLASWGSLSASGPRAITASAVTTIARDATHVDVVAILKNANTNWGASRLTAHFVVAGQTQPTLTVFLNPDAERPVMALNVAVPDSAQASSTVAIDSTTWAKASAAALPVPAFSVDNQQLTPTTVTINHQSISTITLRAAVTNRSVYNFYHVTVPIVVSDGTTPVAVGEIVTDAWPTLTSKSLPMTWSYPLGGSLTAKFFPQVSRFDLTNVFR